MPSHSTAARPAQPVAGAAKTTTDISTETWVLFSVDDQTYALDMWEVDRIVRAVEVKPLPEVPPHIRGVVNVQGRVLPVIDLRIRFEQKPRPISASDHFLIARTGDLSVILSVDAALGSQDVSTADIPPDSKLPRCVRKVVPLDLGVIYALDMQQLLFGDESPTDSQLASILRELQKK